MSGNSNLKYQMSTKRLTRKSANRLWKRLFFHEGQIVRIHDYITRSRFESKIARIESIDYKIPFPIQIRPWEDDIGAWMENTIPVTEEEIEPINLDDLEEGDPCYG